jgi:hypothetical protein
VLLGLLFLGARILQRTHPGPSVILHAPVLLTFWIIVWFILPGIASLVYPDLVSEMASFTDLDPTYMIWGGSLVSASMLSLWIGYAIGLNTIKPFRLLNSLRNTIPTHSIVIQLYVLSITVRLFRILTIGVAYNADSASGGTLFQLFDQWLGYLEATRFLVIALISVQCFRGEWPRSTLIAVICVELLFTVTSGFMKPLMFVFLLIAISALTSGVVVRRFVPYSLVLLGMLVLTIPIAEDLRPRLRMAEFDARSVPTVLGSAWEATANTWGTSVESAFRVFVTKAVGRQAMVAYMPGVIMQKTPSVIPYQGWDQFLSIPAYIIPRSIWVDKPVLSRGLWFSVTYLNIPSHSPTSSALTTFGEAYMFAGWPAALLALLILGFAVGGLYRNTVSVGLAPLYVSLVPLFVDHELQFTTMIVSLAQSFLIFLLVYWLLVRLSQPRAVAPVSVERR